MARTFQDVLRLKARADDLQWREPKTVPPAGHGPPPPPWVADCWHWIERLCPQFRWMFFWRQSPSLEARVFAGEGNSWYVEDVQSDWIGWKMGAFKAAQWIVDRALTAHDERLKDAFLEPGRLRRQFREELAETLLMLERPDVIDGSML